MSVLTASGSARPLPAPLCSRAFILSAPSIASGLDLGIGLRVLRLHPLPRAPDVDQPTRHGPLSVTADK
jgi:hypothetical protein